MNIPNSREGRGGKNLIVEKKMVCACASVCVRLCARCCMYVYVGVDVYVGGLTVFFSFFSFLKVILGFV